MTVAPDTAPGAHLLASPVRRMMVDQLAQRGAMTAAQLAEVVGLHVTTARFHLDQLVDGGILETSFVKQQSGVGRPRKMYAVSAGSLHQAPRESGALEVLAALLAGYFGARDDEGAPLTPAEAGRRWALAHVESGPDQAPADSPGRWLGKVGEMIDVLADWGYTPDLSTSNGGRTARVVLDHCPFLDLAQQNPAVVCGIHRGLIAGAMERLGEGDTEISLEPFVGPSRCLAHVTTHTPFR